jgi:hypothetical protein
MAGSQEHGDDMDFWVYSYQAQKSWEQTMTEDEKLTLVGQAITELEMLSDSQVTPLAVMAWLTLHAHIELSLSEIGSCMQKIYQKRGEH